MKICNVFFDLDRTLWDFESNSQEMLSELYKDYKLDNIVDADEGSFILKYKEINEYYWEKYRIGEVNKETLRTIRFHKTFEYYKVKNKELSDAFAGDYIQKCPLKPGLLPGTKELLDYLHNKVKLHIITNGFEEVQHVKMEASGINQYFDVVMTSEKAGCKKPDTDIFIKALKDADADASTSLMVGDHFEIDVIGAQNVGMKALLYDPYQTYPGISTGKIHHLSEIQDIIP